MGVAAPMAKAATASATAMMYEASKGVQAEACACTDRVEDALVGMRVVPLDSSPDDCPV